ncbi:MAG: arginine--tRNA ligase [Opitutales bacterium]
MQIAFHTAKFLESLLQKATEALAFNDFDCQIKIADPRFGDFQANGALGFAKKNKMNPREVGQKLLEEIQNSAEFDSSLMELSIAGAGFINFKFTPKFLMAYLSQFKSDKDLKQASANLYAGKKIVIDYPSPNTAKQMHVGHLRPMVIGESIQRLLRFCGADVTCDNHIGDWGTNFGTLIYGIKTQGYNLDVNNESALEDLEQLYKLASAKSKEDVEYADACRNELAKLQAGDEENTKYWNAICKISEVSFDKMYDALSITTDLTLGESFYRDKVDRIYTELTEIGLAKEDQGALVVFLEDHPQFKTQPFIIRKKDGASNYASTDLATILYRVQELKANELIYVTDARQQDHFKQLFITTQKWFDAKGYDYPSLKHVFFGTILGEDGKAIKTKSGEPIRLRALIDEAVKRALEIVESKNPDMPKEELLEIATAVGIGALKYADLCQNRTNDYTFAWSKLLAFEGNTAPYLLYALARIYSIFRKANIDINSNFETEICDFDSEQEIALARKLISLPNVFDLSLSELRVHHLCTYIYELAGTFSAFYNTNKVIVDDPKVMNKRLMLCSRTLRYMEAILQILAIKTLQKM